MLDNETDDVENLKNLMKASKRLSVAMPNIHSKSNMPNLGSNKELSEGSWRLMYSI
jgi:hypothetical protein